MGTPRTSVDTFLEIDVTRAGTYVGLTGKVEIQVLPESAMPDMTLTTKLYKKK